MHEITLKDGTTLALTQEEVLEIATAELERRRGISQGKKGTKHSQEVREAISRMNKAAWGRLTPEQRTERGRRISEGRRTSGGEKT